MAEYTLHCFAQSGNSYKPALFLELAGADWAPRQVDFFGGETRTPAYRAINFMGEVPVLEHEGGRLAQSGVILDYLAGRLGLFGWNDDDERRDILRWLLWDNHKLTSYTATYRFMRHFMKSPDPAVVETFRQRSESAYRILDAHLRTHDFAVAERLTIADLSMCGYLFYEGELAVDWKDFPGIRAWLDRIRTHSRWKHPYDLMPGHPLPDRS